MSAIKHASLGLGETEKRADSSIIVARFVSGELSFLLCAFRSYRPFSGVHAT